MKSNLGQWFVNTFRKTIHSIAFYPAFIASLFLGLSYLMIHLDFSDTGKQVKTQMEWLRLKDASTARTIISVIAAGILSLTVFTFTMVMVILNQAASQMSNRVLDKLIGNRYQQFILGFYIGTIVYSLFLLSAIRDIDSGIYVPSLSTYLLIAFAVIDIFLFIYFLHFITQSVKYGVIIKKIYRQTLKALKATCRLDTQPDLAEIKEGWPLQTMKDGIFEGFNKDALIELAREHNIAFTFPHSYGTYVISGVPILMVHSQGPCSEELQKQIRTYVFINDEETVDLNFFYGFRQLTEVAMKALSPGINDPGTAVESLRSLVSLLAYRMHHFADNAWKDDQGQIRIITRELSFEEIFNRTILPIWDYGKSDRFVQKELSHLLQQLLLLKPHVTVSTFLEKVEAKIKEAESIE